jgi:arylsulfatase A-like enzyme
MGSIMKGLVCIKLLLLFSFAVRAQSKHVVLVSIDGLRPEMYQDRLWPAPHLQKLMDEGVYAEGMKSVFPSYTYPSHVAMLTGAMPARSGIYYNAKQGSQDWNWFTSDIKVPTIWQVLKQNGLTTAAIQWPVSVSNDITWNIPEIWDSKNPRDRITATRKYATPDLIEEIELNATGKLDSTNMNEAFAGLDNNAGRMAAYIFTTYKPNLLAVHFAGVDGKQHEHGRGHPEVIAAVQNVDHAIGVILEAIERSGLKETTSILIVGDHGFIDNKFILCPNNWIENFQAYFHPAGGSAFLYANPLLADLVITAIPKRYKKYFRVIRRKELDQMGVDSSVVLALAAKRGIVFSGNKGEQLTAIEGGHHGYNPNLKEMHTGFIAAGAEINKGRVIDELCVTDIAPLIAALLGISFEAPDGKLVPGILKNK